MLVDDYFHLKYTGVREAIDAFVLRHHLIPIPVGDGRSAFLQKPMNRAGQKGEL